MHEGIGFQRLLVERAELDGLPGLLAWLDDTSVDAIGLNVGAIHALATLGGLTDARRQPEVQAAIHSALEHPSAGVRRVALTVLPPSAESTAALLASGVLNDDDAQVRLAALLALADAEPHPAAGAALAALLCDPAVLQDRWLPDALTAAAARHATSMLIALAEDRPENRQLARLPNSGQRVLRTVSEHLARGKLSADELAPLVSHFPKLPRAAVAPVIEGLGAGWPDDHGVKLPETSDQALAALLPALDAQSQATLVGLADRWGSMGLAEQRRAIVQGLERTVQDDEAPAANRIDAARRLVAFEPTSDRVVDALLDDISARMPTDVAVGIIQAVGTSRSERAPEALLDRMGEMTPSVQRAIIASLLARSEWTPRLVDAIEAGRIPGGDLTLDQRQALQNHPNRALRRRATTVLSRAGGLPSPDRQKVLEEMLPLAERTGDVALGREVYRKHCANCHRHGGQGGDVGPDLTGMAVHPKSEMLVHILDPNRDVEGNYRTYTVVTVDGRVLTGMLAGESRTSIEVVDAEAKRQIVQRADIDELVPTGKSLMPDGFEKQMTADEMVHLLEFLTAKGRYVPLPLGSVATAVSTRSLFHAAENGPDRLVFNDWKPKTFREIPFLPTDPRDGAQPNIILLHGPLGTMPPRMPRNVRLDCNTEVAALHLLSGVSGWGFPAIGDESVSMIVRFHYADGRTEDHPLRNGVHFADYIRRVDVPGSEFAFALGNQQLRYLAVQPRRQAVVEAVEFVKGNDATAPIIMAVTVERPGQEPAN